MGSDQERRALIAIVLSLGVYLLWTAFFAPKLPKPAPGETEVAAATEADWSTEAAPAPASLTTPATLWPAP